MGAGQKKSVLPRQIRGFRVFDNEGEIESTNEQKLTHATSCTVLVQAGDWHGSGFFVAPGIIVTNEHVVGNSRRISVRLQDETIKKAEVLSISTNYDLAILKVDFTDHPILEIATRETVSVGEDVVALGYPIMKDLTVLSTFGKISAKDRVFQNNPCYHIDVTINKGNSGGPLVSMKTGKVVGINTFSLNQVSGELDAGIDRFNFSVIMDVAVSHLEREHPEVSLTVD